VIFLLVLKEAASRTVAAAFARHRCSSRLQPKEGGSELQEEQLAMHQLTTVEAAAAAKVTIESLIAEAEAARAKAMSEKGGAAAAVIALTAKAKLAGMWREKVHNTGAVYERIERVIVERPDEEPTEATKPTNGQKPWWAD
jgi:hypothetical protein